MYLNKQFIVLITLKIREENFHFKNIYDISL